MLNVQTVGNHAIITLFDKPIKPVHPRRFTELRAMRGVYQWKRTKPETGNMLTLRYYMAESGYNMQEIERAEELARGNQ